MYTKTCSHTRSYIASACLIIGTTSAMAAGYTVKDLGPGNALDLNNKGQVVGSQPGGPVLWLADGSVQSLQGLTGAFKINDKGNILGGKVTQTNDPRYPQKQLFFRDTTGTNTLITSISTLSETSAASIALDGTDRVLASSSYSVNFFWSPQNPTITTLHTAKDKIYGLSLTGMNASGMVTGTGTQKAATALGYTTVNFVGSTPSKGADLGLITPIKTLSFKPQAINAGNQVVGTREVRDASTYTLISAKAYLWSMATGERVLPNLAGAKGTYPNKINVKGEVIGDALKSNATTGVDERTAYYWSAKTGAVDINTKISATTNPITALHLAAINDAGQIAATGTINGESHALLLTPAP